MSINWSDEEKRHVLKSTMKGKTAREIARELEEMGYPERTPASVRGVRRRALLEMAVEYEEESVDIEFDEPDDNMIIEEPAKILYFDIETTDFKADFGEMICMGYRWHHEDEYKIVKINDFDGWDELEVENRDRYLVERVADIIAEADVLVGHYSKRFDHRFIQTRCLMHGLKVIPDPPHIDTWQIAKYQCAFTRNSMKVMADRLDCDDTKSHVNWRIWRRLKAHDEEAIETISTYCIQDVRTQYAMTQKLLPLAKHMPNMNILTGEVNYRCPGCGSDNVQRRGFHTTKINKFQRFQCQECGKWSRGRKTVLGKDVERQMY